MIGTKRNYEMEIVINNPVATRRDFVPSYEPDNP